MLGFGTGLGLIVAIGAQNAYLLRIGLASPPRTVVAAVLICVTADAALIIAGIAGVGALVGSAPLILVVARYAGAAFLIVYGALAARRALRGSESLQPDGSKALVRPLLALLAMTWLNPHVYLDTLVLLGTIANQQPDAARWWFGAGAVIGSVFWFTSLGFAARLLRPLFARSVTWRILDAVIALVLFVIAGSLLVGM
ncbi:amino acid transporter [Amnibacterium flavum]|uniref:Amino acid transporter n=1 Tax=Amnibacterium flavum TaxID=2173173 RepID=A0A2V1HV15_9MICO|nr:amino acid transporter [Amnibacterium flavum]